MFRDPHIVGDDETLLGIETDRFLFLFGNVFKRFDLKLAAGYQIGVEKRIEFIVGKARHLLFKIVQFGAMVDFVDRLPDAVTVYGAFKS